MNSINMIKENIVVIPNHSRLQLSLAYHNKNLFNTHFYTPIELAKKMLDKEAIHLDKQLISKSDELLYFKKIVSDIKYFNTTKLADIKNINNAINTARKLVISDEKQTLKNTLSKGIFTDKNDALLKTYDRYIDALDKDNKIDSIGLIRYAIDNITKKDIEITIIDEYSLMPLEIELINSITDNIKSISIFDLFGVKENGIHINEYRKCYGSSNEVGTILDDILNNTKADECVIACGDYPSYSQTLYDYACKYDIDISFGDGLSIVNSNPGKLLRLYNNWTSTGQFGWLSFNELIYSPYFDLLKLKSLLSIDELGYSKFFDHVSKLRLTNDSSINQTRIKEYTKAISNDEIIDTNKEYLPSIEVLAKELALPVENFIEKYALVRNSNEFVNRFDIASIKSINNEISSIRNIGLEISDDVIETLLNKLVYRESNKPGKIHICSIENGLSSLRNNLYICGLSSTVYPGTPKENPLLLDSDLNDFNNTDLTSNGKIKHKQESLLNLIKLATSLNNNIYLSYPGLNISELKNNNASSLLFEIYKLESGDNKTLDDFKNNVINVSYFEPNLSKSRLIGQAYNKADEIVFKALESNNKDFTCLSLKRYSPSALNTFFNCKKQFFYQYLLGIKQLDEYNPYEVIPATDQGSLVHSLMEYLSKHKMSKQEFLNLGKETFDKYMKICVPLINEKIDSVREEFVEMLENGYQMDEDNKREVMFAEEDIEVTHLESGVVIHGFPDRVEKLGNGKAVIVDFKTERKKNNHIKDDIDTCLQVLIYAYIVEYGLNTKVDHCEYRMLRFPDGIITCKYDDEIKKELSLKLNEFKYSINTGDFSIEPMNSEEEAEKCKYCSFGSICGKVVSDDE